MAELKPDVDLCCYYRQFQSTSIVNGLVYRTFIDNHGNVRYFQLIFPTSMRNALLELVHVSVLCHAKKFD
jgi:hypothetical protein